MSTIEAREAPAPPRAPAVPSVRRRFAFTVGMNVLRSALTFGTGLLLARWLGPSAFGDMAFLLGTFVGLRGLLDLGTSNAFFTFLSQRTRSKRFVFSYYGWLALQFAGTLVVVGLLFPSRWIDGIWRGQLLAVILLAFAATFLQNSVWPVIQQAGESQRRTVLVQSVGVVAVVLHAAVTVVLWRTGRLGLPTVFASLAVVYLVASVIAQSRLSFPTVSAEGEDALGPLIRKYWWYCLPMIPYAAVGFAQEFADRWLLQAFGGGVQQAFYAVGAQFAAIALLATSSILRIFWKEVAEAHHLNDHARAHRLYRRVSRLLFLVGAVVAGFLIPWSGALLLRFLGPDYVGGALTLAIMFLYPVHQSMGQIGNTVLLATEKVRLQAALGIVGMLTSIVVSYVVLAPRTAPIPGLGLASAGLALKMVGVQLVFVNIVAYSIARLWRQPFDWVYQPVSLGGCIAMGWLAHAAVVLVLGSGSNLVLSMALAASAYGALVAAFVYALPWTAGVTRAELVNNARRAVAIGRLALTRSA